MTELYTTTRQLLELIKQVKPEIETNVCIGAGGVLITPLSTDCLMSVLPKLFAGVENPQRERDLKWYSANDLVGDLDMESPQAQLIGISIHANINRMPPDLATALSRRYFDYDENGQSLWQKDQVEVLTDLIKEVKRVYKVD